jgi:hypothetical protein
MRLIIGKELEARKGITFSNKYRLELEKVDYRHSQKKENNRALVDI